MRRRDVLKMLATTPVVLAAGDVPQAKTQVGIKQKFEVVLLDTRNTEITKRQHSTLEQAEKFTFHFKRKGRVKTLAIYRDGICVYRKIPWGENGYITADKDDTVIVNLDLPGLVLEHG